MEELNVVSCSDIHLGHPRVPVEHIETNLNEFFFPYFIQAFLAFFGGDIFHQLLRIDAYNTQSVLSVINRVLSLAKEHGIILRILRGTFTHDRGQNTLFETLNESYKVDLKCIDSVSLEYIEKYNLRILYIPDNLPYSDSDECLREIHTLMRNMQWDYVDFVVMHGYFEHVLPEGIPHKPHCTFRKEQFDSFVKHYVLVGHVHTPSKNGKIIYNGSFDRLCHGEEEKKGFFFLTHKPEDTWKIKFIENKHAMNFVTIHPTGETLEELIEFTYRLIKQKFGEHPNGYLRIILDDPEKRQLIIQHILATHNKDLIVTGLNPKNTTTDLITTDQPEFQTYEQIVPTQENLAELVYLHIQKTKGNCELTTEQIHEHLLHL